MDRRLGLPSAALLRFILGLGGLVALTRYFPLITAGSEQALLMTTVLVGMSYGVAFGTSYQIASKYTSGATVALTTGALSLMCAGAETGEGWVGTEVPEGDIHISDL